MVGAGRSGRGSAGGALIVFIAIFGAAQGAVTLARPSILAERYGVSHYGRISSIMALFLTLTSTAAPLVASLLHDGAASYQPVLWMVAFFAVIATGVLLLVRQERPPALAHPAGVQPGV